MQVRVAHRVVSAGLLTLLLAGCAAENQGAVKGAIVGAAGGGLAGVAAGGNDARNMALGAVIGGLIGAITGDVVQKRQAAATPQPRRPRRRRPAPRPAPPARTVVRGDGAPAAPARGAAARRKSGPPP